MKSLSDLIASANKGPGLRFQNELMAKALAEVNEQKEKEIVKQCVSVLDIVSSTISTKVELLRKIRENECLCKNDLDNLNKAAEHFAKTNNPLPFLRLIHNEKKIVELCSQMGISVPDKNDEAFKF